MNYSGRPKTSIVERFFSKIIVNPKTQCWEWSGTKRSGYGRITTGGVRGSVVSAHRFSYEHHIGPIPAGLVLDHICQNRSCCNPSHLEPVTNRENILRGTGIAAKNASKVFCKRGHLLAGENLFVQANGARGCCQCRRDYSRAYMQKTRRARALNEGRI